MFWFLLQSLLLTSAVFCHSRAGTILSRCSSLFTLTSPFSSQCKTLSNFPLEGQQAHILKILHGQIVWKVQGKELPDGSMLKNNPGPEGRRDITQGLCPKREALTSGLCFDLHPVNTETECDKKSRSKINVMSCTIVLFLQIAILHMNNHCSFPKNGDRQPQHWWWRCWKLASRRLALLTAGTAAAHQPLWHTSSSSSSHPASS